MAYEAVPYEAAGGYLDRPALDYLSDRPRALDDGVRRLTPQEERIARTVEARVETSWSWVVWSLFYFFLLFVGLLLLFVPWLHSTPPNPPFDSSSTVVIFSPWPILFAILLFFCCCLIFVVLAGTVWWATRPPVAVVSRDRRVRSLQ